MIYDRVRLGMESSASMVEEKEKNGLLELSTFELNSSNLQLQQLEMRPPTFFKVRAAEILPLNSTFENLGLQNVVLES